ncbi:LysR family transcriptional regulator [Allostella sp. ATCC 35155]|nr:LysR family transcriptional regulator [Stella sp. ATCC 35155]
MVTMRQLEAFCAVIDHQTVTEAARVMRLSQPAVSKLVATLEQDTRLSLFRRDRRRLVPTEEGLILHRQAQAIFDRLHDIERLSEELRNLAGGRLNIVTMMALGRTFLPDAMSAFLRERPAVVASLHVRSSRTVVDQIAGQQADLGFTMLPSEDPAVVARVLCRLKGVCVLPPDHRLAAQPVIRADDLEGERFISFSLDSSMRRSIDEVFEREGVRRQLTIDAYVSAAACSFVANGMGVSIVEPFTAWDFVRLGQVVARPFEPDVVFEFRMLRPAGRPPSLLAEAFATQVERLLVEHIALTGAETSGEGADPRPLSDWSRRRFGT